MSAVTVLNENINVAWAPMPGSQVSVLTCPVYEVLYEGTRGGGKTDTILMDFAKDVGRGYGADWKGIIFRRTFPELGDIIDKTKKWFPLIFGNDVRFNETKTTWVWKTGERLLLRPFEKDSDYWKYHGHQYPWQAWEELCTHATSAGYLKMFSCCRSSNPHVAKIARIRATANPGGVGHNWVKQRFKLPGSRGRIIRGEVDASGNPEPPRVAIMSSIRENRALMDADPGYLARLESSASTDAERRAWIFGDWDIVSGGMFDDLWDPNIHLVRPFRIPDSWRIERSFDWGSSKPFSLGWWAISDGGDVMMGDGKVHSTVRGDRFRIGEWYGWSGKPNEGCKMLAVDVARGGVERELKMGIFHRVQAGFADSAIYKTENGVCIATDMAARVRLDDGREYRGLSFQPADKSGGSRALGWEAVRKMLGQSRPVKSGPREKPGLFIFNTCEHFIRCFPVTPRDKLNPDDVDTDFEDHIQDEVRYVCRGVGSSASFGMTQGMS